MNTTSTDPRRQRVMIKATPPAPSQISESDWDDDSDQALAAEAQTARHPAPGRVLAAGLRVRRHHVPGITSADPAVRHLPGPVAFRGQHRHADLRRLRRRGAGRPAAGGPVLGPGRAQAGAGRGPRRQRAEHGRVHLRPRRGSARRRIVSGLSACWIYRNGHGRAHRTGSGLTGPGLHWFGLTGPGRAALPLHRSSGLGRPAPGLAGGHGREHGRPWVSARSSPGCSPSTRRIPRCWCLC